MIIKAILFAILWQCICGIIPDPLCLVNRVDVLPCNFNGTPMPTVVDNQYGIYGTTIGNPPQGLNCGIDSTNHQIKNINTNGGSEPFVKYFFSPGSELAVPEDYGNQNYILYKMTCPANRLAYFRLLKLDLEELNCTVSSTEKCVDYLRVTPVDDTGAAVYGSIEACGTDINQLDAVTLSSGNLDILLRTSEQGRFPGFRAVVICIPTTSSRRKRSTQEADAFESELQQRLDSVPRIRNLALMTGNYLRFPASQYRVVDLIIQFDHSFVYRPTKLFISQGTNRTKVDCVLDLKVVNAQGEVTSYKREARDQSGQLLTFEGPGTLVVVGSCAFYRNFIVDPRGILPLLPEESEVVRRLSLGHFEQNILELPEERLCPALLEPPPFTREDLLLDNDIEDTVNITIPECPRPEATAENTCNWSDEDLRLAVANLESNNIVVRTIADVAIRCTQRVQPGRLEELFQNPNLTEF